MDSCYPVTPDTKRTAIRYEFVCTSDLHPKTGRSLTREIGKTAPPIRQMYCPHCNNLMPLTNETEPFDLDAYLDSLEEWLKENGEADG